jgi:hypothetical protein
MLSVVLSLILGAIGVVPWIAGGPHPRTAGAWLMLGAILIVSATPMLMCPYDEPPLTSPSAHAGPRCRAHKAGRSIW